MRMLSIVLLGIFLSGMVRAATDSPTTSAPDLFCQQDHRNGPFDFGLAELTLNLSSDLVIDDVPANLQGSDALGAYLQEKFGDDEGYAFDGLVLRIPAATIGCTQPLATVFACQGRAPAQLELHRAWTPWLEQDIEVVHADVQTSPESDGPIRLGGDATTVTLSTTQVKASVDLLWDGRPFHLEWTPAFKNCSQR